VAFVNFCRTTNIQKINECLQARETKLTKDKKLYRFAGHRKTSTEKNEGGKSHKTVNETCVSRISIIYYMFRQATKRKIDLKLLNSNFTNSDTHHTPSSCENSKPHYHIENYTTDKLRRYLRNESNDTNVQRRKCTDIQKYYNVERYIRKQKKNFIHCTRSYFHNGIFQNQQGCTEWSCCQNSYFHSQGCNHRTTQKWKWNTQNIL